MCLSADGMNIHLQPFRIEDMENRERLYEAGHAATLGCLALLREVAEAMVGKILSGDAEPGDIGRLAALYARLGGNPADLVFVDEEIEGELELEEAVEEMEEEDRARADVPTLRLLATIAHEATETHRVEAEELRLHISALGGDPDEDASALPSP
jgi:hypothetical protein